VSLVDEGVALAEGARNEFYGPPIEDFGRTGRMWGAILGIPDVEPEKVALCLIAVKISRESFRHHQDNVRDISGYAHTIEMIREARCPA
jgi:hypothetical protein